MADAKDFYKKWRHVLVWTACYIFVMWLILRGLFNFNMFSAAHWLKMLHVELHGFPGFVFGIMILAAVPLYIATTVFVCRTQETPVKIHLPKCLAEKPKKPEPEKPKPVVTEQEVLVDLPKGVPAEMREIFMRAHKNYGVRQMSVFNRPSKFDNSPIATTSKDVPAEPVPVVAPSSNSAPVETQKSAPENTSENPEFPIPTDFDTPPAKDFDVPVFSDINFGDDTDDDDTPDNDANVPEYTNLRDIISGAGHSTEIVGNLIVVNNCAVAVHSDSDFWVADELDWFASGRQKPSPIVELKKIAQEKGVTPILYLGETNIMDFDKVSNEWKQAGVTVVTNQDELLKLIQDSKK